MSLHEHFRAMQDMAARWLEPNGFYVDREGVVWSDNDPEPFASDMIYMLDGPEQRAAQGMSARQGENSRSQVEGEARQPGPATQDAPHD